MANVFSSLEFLSAASETLCAGRRTEIITATVEGRLFRLLRVEGRPVSALPFFDFLEPIEGSSERAFPVAFLSQVSLESVAVAGWEAGAVGDSLASSPWVDWGQFARWELFLAHIANRHRKPFNSSRKLRKLERERGVVRFEADSRDRDLLRQCMEWKSQQYRRTRVVDVFSSDRIVAFFQRLFDEGLLIVSALFAGETAVAVHLGCRWEQRFYYWVPAYDESTASCSPGGLLLEALLEESHRRGDREFDFLIGGEDYKFHYATDVRLIRQLGRPPLTQRLWGPLRNAVMPHIRRFETPYRTLQILKRRAREMRLR
jgi:hypothetical protein